jgi:hypothetical protein
MWHDRVAQSQPLQAGHRPRRGPAPRCYGHVIPAVADTGGLFFFLLFLSAILDLRAELGLSLAIGLGNSIFGIMSRLSEDGGDPAVRASFQKTMSGNFDNTNDAPFSPLELIVMELFRVISPNGGSISAIQDARTSAHGASPQERFGFPMERHSYISTPHTSTSGKYHE